MIRISTIFIAVCMVLIAASLGMVVYAAAGFSAAQSALVGLTSLTLFALYQAMAMRQRDRSEANEQVADLSRGTTDLARQVGEFGRRLAVVEAKLVSSQSVQNDRVKHVSDEIGELGTLVQQLAASVAAHEELLTAAARSVIRAEAAPAPLELVEPVAPPPATVALAAPVVVAPAPASETPPEVVSNAALTAPAAAPAASSAGPTPHPDAARLLPAVKSAVEAERFDLYLQPMVTLPQRKVRAYEVVTRLRDQADQPIAADDYLPIADAAGLMGRIDLAILLRAVQVVRRLLVRNKEVGLFVNIAASTLADGAAFAQCLDFLEANRALAPSLLLEFKQSTFRKLGAIEAEHLAALAQRGYRFSIDHVTDLRFEPRELADRGVRFIKVPAALLLAAHDTASADIHPVDLSDLLGRFGIDLIAERIEGERAVVDLLDYDVRFGQGFLFAAPRPLRPETATTAAAPVPAAPAPQDINLDPGKIPQGSLARIEPARVTGNAALARRAAGPF
ncbi:cyclic-di-GMP phosphodiesterase TipF (flagellum assembly factor) [Rhodopseudomonas thermotolerans]|uniref:Cyclic-di-GMP phosphodiesterase TipF (Flagellum assembly factor) n=2 Tax=Rhodopseudomonas TaxID=1073 RepID=A0A336JR01_9BRAD|nr:MULTISPECIES: EAL domain-containing protein [Rhodopseudomonas]RED37562.1 cyclic-di-GMP phosphodiesterase TipF (flagellum assembly factor) [Rhodopseudomonas pentothenatexigens]REG04048.1 cyclic-di-GMP phosphodiesterase TipF (flagellum assembly factor) [Rhodopseudomonas thermotolerans]SSW90529.1 cyclic-di-GMP phosphodiesterase TipF (flagellum assembly factor) [Rhodopseudomonas pentothenatexigens]